MHCKLGEFVQLINGYLDSYRILMKSFKRLYKEKEKFKKRIEDLKKNHYYCLMYRRVSVK